MKLAAIVILFLTFFAVAGCGSSHMYYSEAQVYVKALNQEMDRAGLPVNGKVLFEAGGWEIGPFKGGGIYVSAYEVKSPALGIRLIERAREIHTQLPGIPVTVTIYSNAHIDNIHSGKEVILASTKIR